MRLSLKMLLMVLTAFFLIGLLSLQGVFAQEIKKPRPSNPFLGEVEGAVNASRSIQANITQAGCREGIKLVVDEVNGPYNVIQDAIEVALDGDTIKVMPGTYPGFKVIGRNCLKIVGEAKESANVIVTGSVSVITYRGTYSLTIGVVNSTNIEISYLTVQAGNTDPFSIAYFNSTGEVKHNDVGGNTGNSNPGNSIAAFGITSPGTVTIEHNYIHNYGKIGILVNSFGGPGPGPYAPSGIHAEIKHNIIVGTNFEDYWRVQDGIQVTNGGSADIEHNDISGNFQTGTYTDPDTGEEYSGSYWTCDGIMLFDADVVTTKKNKLYNNQMGIAIQQYVNNATLDDDDINNNEWGLYTWNWIPSTIVVKGAKNKIKENIYGWVNWDTDGIVFERCRLNENEFGMYASAWYTVNPTATFNHCNITENTEIDVEHDSNTLIFNKTKHGTYMNYGGGILIEN